MKRARTILVFCMLALSASGLMAQTANQFIKAGNEAYDSGEYYEAISYYKQALKFDKQQDELQYKIGMAYYELKDYENAAIELLSIKGSDANEQFPFLSFYKGDTYKLIGKYDKAIAEFKQFRDSYRENDFYAEKAKQEMASCAWAKDQVQSEEVMVKHYPKPINTGYSEFGAGYINDSILQVSSLQPLDKKDKKSPFVSDLYFYTPKGDDWEKMAALGVEKQEELELANGYYVQETNRFFYTQCEAVSATEKRCDIYVVNKLIGGSGSTALKLAINDAEATNTQPMVYVNEQGREVLYFVSDRKGGEGKLDIWMSEADDYSNFHTPVNLGPTINTIDDESTPYYKEEESTLYFSSKWHYGFGGQDVFKSYNSPYGFVKPKNLGAPINSSANDQYFYWVDDENAFLSSNRQGALQLRGSACCFDVYGINLPIPEPDTIPTDTLVDSVLLASDPPKIELTPFEQLEAMLPATVYFHNDEPNPKTTNTSTRLSYANCYDDYVSVKPDYYETFDNKGALDDFFSNEVDAGYNNLQQFAEQLNDLLPSTYIELTLEGYCSPLALNKYNIYLAQRRISSLKNFFGTWNNGALKGYIKSGKLSFTAAPFGEEKAAGDISDDYYDTKSSIYNPKAAQERKVAIIAVAIK